MSPTAPDDDPDYGIYAHVEEELGGAAVLAFAEVLQDPCAEWVERLANIAGALGDARILEQLA